MRLAGHLGKTLAEMDQMDSREFSRWIAYARWFRPLDDSWKQMSWIMCSVLAPHAKRVPELDAFIPVEDKAPQHWTQIYSVIEQMKKDLEG